MARQRFFVPETAPFLEVRTTLDSALPYAEHFHSAFSLGLMLAGKTRFSLEGEKHTAGQGDMVLIAPGQAHSCNPVNGAPRSYHMLFIDGAWFGERAKTALRLRGAIGVSTPVIKDAELFAKAAALVHALDSTRHGAETALTDLLLTLHERHGCFAPAAEKRRFAALYPDGLDVPWSAGESCAASSVSQLAKNAGMRRESFSRAVRRKTGLPPSSCLHCLRLEKGRRLLRQGESIAQAALAAGYADQSHFHHTFVRFFSVTPGCYQKSGSHPYKT